MTANMSKSDMKSLPVHEMDTNILFEKYSVEEIRDIEKRTRADIERKKEDLRTMVGERYRDLIEAADTIAEMKTSAENVMSTIGRIETLCSELKKSQMVKSSTQQQKKKQEMDNRRKEERKFHEVASQIKLLLDIPEKMWTCLDCDDFLSASRLYLLAQHINTSLQLTSQSAPNFLYWFPVLTRQWAAISHFKVTILQGCRRLLKETSMSDQKIAESLCSILLLENSNPRQVFNEFLLARTSAIQQLFHVSGESLSTKEQICTVVLLITTTIHQIHAVFYADDSKQPTEDKESTNLLLQTLTKVTTEKQHESGLVDLQSSVSSRCLPKSVTDFCPTHKSVSLGVSQQHLQDNCTQWMNTCVTDVRTGVSKLLNFVNTVKHLASIRDTVWEMMAEDKTLSEWKTVCERVLNKSVLIWEDLLRPLFLERVKALIKFQLDSTVEVTQRQISKLLSELECDGTRLSADIDLSSYIWSESPGDIAANTAWGLAGSRSLLESGGLMMKAKAFTPIVQTFCRSFDEKFDSVSEDYKFYVFSDPSTASIEIESQPFNRFADSLDLLVFIQTSCVDCIQGILQFLSDLMEECKATLAQARQRCSGTGHKLLLCGRLCAAMCDLMPHLQQCMLGKDQLSRQDRSMLKRSSSGRLSVGGKQESCALWESTKAQLMQYQHTVYKLWLDHVIQIGLADFRTAVLAETPADVIKTCSRWEEVCIEEETDDGKKVTSKISVPMQSSWYLLALLYGLCNDLNNIGGHAVARNVLEHLVIGLSEGIMNTYVGVLNQAKTNETSLNQQRALQLLFDVKFLRLILPRKDDSKESKMYQKMVDDVVSRLEEVVDPFDMDVFSPFMQANLTKLLQRSAILLRGLTSVDKSALYGLTSRPSPSSQQEQHNVLLLSTCHSRFSLLPLSIQQSRTGAPQPVITQTLYRGTETSRPSLAETAAAVLPHSSQQKMASSSSFYDRIGTGLGSMSDISNWFSTIGTK